MVGTGVGWRRRAALRPDVVHPALTALRGPTRGMLLSPQAGWLRVSRYDFVRVDIYSSARKHGVVDADMVHAVQHALAVGEQDDAKVLYLGPDGAGNLLEVVSVARDDGTEIVIHAMRMRAKYEPFLRGEGDSDA